MNLSKLSMIFIVVFAALFIPLTWFTHVSALTAQVSDETRSKLINAVYDAMKETNEEEGLVFDSVAKRSDVLDTFYASLASSYGLTAADSHQETVVKSHIPFVALADNNGVYVCYSSDYTNWGRYDKDIYKITPLSTYSETYKLSNGTKYFVQYYLNGQAEIYKNGEWLCGGNYNTLIKKLSETDPSTLSIFTKNHGFLESEQMFNDERQALITNVITRTVEQYINKEISFKDNIHTKNGYNLRNTQYQVAIPQDEKADFANALSAPTILTFYQGEQFSTQHDYVMAVALTGSEKGIVDKYYITNDNGTLYYHNIKAADNCKRFNNTMTGDSKTRLFTIEEAAKKGAYPCPDCIH